MKRIVQTAHWPVWAALWLAALLPLEASMIYDNSVNDMTNRFHTGTMEVGDEITLAGTDRNLTNFSFEYFGLSTGPNFAGNVKAEAKFYLNDGPMFNGYATPGTVFYDSGPFSVTPTARSTVNFFAGLDFPMGGLSMPVISNMTWSVQFSGLGSGDDVGVDLFSPVVVGQNTPDYWQKSGSAWLLETNSVSMDFAAQMEATVPEPSQVALWAMGGCGLLMATNRFRRKR